MPLSHDVPCVRFWSGLDHSLMFFQLHMIPVSANFKYITIYICVELSLWCEVCQLIYVFSLLRSKSWRRSIAFISTDQSSGCYSLISIFLCCYFIGSTRPYASPISGTSPMCLSTRTSFLRTSLLYTIGIRCIRFGNIPQWGPRIKQEQDGDAKQEQGLMESLGYFLLSPLEILFIHSITGKNCNWSLWHGVFVFMDLMVLCCWNVAPLLTVNYPYQDLLWMTTLPDFVVRISLATALRVPLLNCK